MPHSLVGRPLTGDCRSASWQIVGNLVHSLAAHAWYRTEAHCQCWLVSALASIFAQPGAQHVQADDEQCWEA